MGSEVEQWVEKTSGRRGGELRRPARFRNLAGQEQMSVQFGFLRAMAFVEVKMLCPRILSKTLFL